MGIVEISIHVLGLASSHGIIGVRKVAGLSAASHHR